jgi:hypothetical protein
VVVTTKTALLREAQLLTVNIGNDGYHVWAMVMVDVDSRSPLKEQSGCEVKDINLHKSLML